MNKHKESIFFEEKVKLVSKSIKRINRAIGRMNCDKETKEKIYKIIIQNWENGTSIFWNFEETEDFYIDLVREDGICIRIFDK